MLCATTTGSFPKYYFNGLVNVDSDIDFSAMGLSTDSIIFKYFVSQFGFPLLNFNWSISFINSKLILHSSLKESKGLFSQELSNASFVHPRDPG